MTKTNLNLEMSCFQLTLNKKINVHCMQIYPFIDIINQYPKDIMEGNLQKKLKHRRSGSLLQKFWYGDPERNHVLEKKTSQMVNRFYWTWKVNLMTISILPTSSVINHISLFIFD